MEINKKTKLKEIADLVGFELILAKLGVEKSINLDLSISEFALEKKLPVAIVLNTIAKTLGSDIDWGGDSEFLSSTGYRKNNLNAKKIIAIASGKGGVGKTFLTTTLARYLIKLEGKRVGILDLDIDCPNIPVVFGVKDKHIANSEKKILPAVIDGIQIISTGLIVDEGKGLAFRGPILAKAIEQMINDSGFDNVEVLLIDMPPGTSDVFLTLVNAVAEAEFLLVTGTGLSAITDLGRVVDLLKKNKKEIVGVVENMVHAELEDSKKDEILKMGLEYITQIELKKIHREKKINDELKLVCKKIVDRLDPI